MLADENLQSVDTYNINKGPVEKRVALENIPEPGAHLLLTLARAIDENTEHLPQIAVGKIWVKNLSSDRVIDVRFNSNTKIKSTDKITTEFSVSDDKGSAIVFLVDDGIHAVTGYKNKDIRVTTSVNASCS